MTFVFASHNKHKAQEMQALLNALLPEPVTLLSLDEIGFSGTIEENGSSFEENARIKARAAARHTRLPCIADDSGIEVRALNGRPGIYSARYAALYGGGQTDSDNLALLLEQMREREDRACRFVCAVAYLHGEKNEALFRAQTDGLLLRAPRGGGGFGYDPAFYYPPLQKSFSELTAEQKNQISHRAKAVRLFADAWKEGIL